MYRNFFLRYIKILAKCVDPHSNIKNFNKMQQKSAGTEELKCSNEKITNVRQ